MGQAPIRCGDTITPLVDASDQGARRQLKCPAYNSLPFGAMRPILGASGRITVFEVCIVSSVS